MPLLRVLSLYMYQNPKRAKKLYKEIVPKTVDEYLELIEKAKKQNELTIINESSLACS